MIEFIEWTYAVMMGALRLVAAAFAGLIAVGISLVIVVAIRETVKVLRGGKEDE